MSLGLSRVFRRGPRTPQANINTRTVAGLDGLLAKQEDRSFDAKKLFVEHYDVLRRGLEAHQEQGVLVVGFDESGTALAQGWLRASLDKTRAAIVGRHTACGLAMPTADRNVSLRHLAVLVRACSHTEVRIRILDLHTSRGFTDETGQVLSAAMAEGPLFIGLDGLRLVFLHTGEAPPDDAEAAYASIPERVLLEERRGTMGIAPRRPVSIPVMASPEQTVVRSSDGPVAAVADLCGDDEPPAGMLVIRGPRTTRRPVGATALHRGVLVGRYDRCAVGFDAERLSRVHFLIVRDGKEVIGIDTASTNGTWVGEREVSLTPMTDGTAVNLANDLQLTWQED